MPDGTEVKWCGIHGNWGDHYRAGHTTDATNNDDGGKTADAGNVTTKGFDEGGGDGHKPTLGAFSRLCEAGLI